VPQEQQLVQAESHPVLVQVRLVYPLEPLQLVEVAERVEEMEQHRAEVEELPVAMVWGETVVQLLGEMVISI
jgi:hypothetical protein